MKAKFVLPLMMAMALVGCGNSAPADPGPVVPPGPTGEYTVTINFNDFADYDGQRKASEDGPRAKLTEDIKAKLVKPNGSSLITENGLTYGDTSTKNTQILKVGYQYTEGAETCSERNCIVLGTTSKAGELHFEFVDTLLKADVYANAYYSWGNTSGSFQQVRDKGSNVTVNGETLEVAQVHGAAAADPSYDEPEMQHKEFDIDGTALDISNEVSSSSSKKRVIIQKMVLTFTTAK